MTTFQLIREENTDSAFYARNGGLFLSDRLPENRFMIIDFWGNGGVQETGFVADLYLVKTSPEIESNLPDKLAFVKALSQAPGKTLVYTETKANKASKLLKHVKDYANEYIRLSGIGR